MCIASKGNRKKKSKVYDCALRVQAIMLAIAIKIFDLTLPASGLMYDIIMRCTKPTTTKNHRIFKLQHYPLKVRVGDFFFFFCIDCFAFILKLYDIW